jgi:hypothetical protein
VQVDHLQSGRCAPSRCGECEQPTADGPILALLQVLQALSNPRHPDLALHLRLAATAIRSHEPHSDIRQWLQGGLFTRLLSILRVLPSLGLSPTDAAAVCAGAAAGIANTLLLSSWLTHVSQPATAASFEQMHLAAQCTDVLAALTRHGILNSAAAAELPLGHEIHVEVEASDSLPAGLEGGGAVDQGLARRFWTPLRICAFTLSMRLVDLTSSCERAVLAELLAPRAFRLLLTTTIDWPCGESGDHFH